MEENNYISSSSNGMTPSPLLSPTSVLAPRPTAWICTYPPSSSSSSSSEQSQKNNPPLIALVEGYCGASDRPPTLMVGSDSISTSVLEGLRVNKVCTLSVATERDIHAAKSMSAGYGCDHGPTLTFDEVGLKPCDPPLKILNALPIGPPPPDTECSNNTENYFKRPPAIASSPVQMHCRLAMEVPLSTSSDSTMILLQIDTYIIHGNVLRTQSTLYPTTKSSIQGNPDVRTITAKIDCLLLRPLASFGNNGRFGRVKTIYHMGRPRPREVQMMDRNRALSRSQKLINSCKPTTTTAAAAAAEKKTNTATQIFDGTTCNKIDWESNSLWEIDDLVPACSIPPEYDNIHDNMFEEGDGQTISYTYRKDNVCPLGYNPMKQVVCPRFIGWISTYEPESLLSTENGGGGSGQPIAHISPYSFCIDVARGSKPMIAFAACPRSDEFDNSDDESDSETEKQRSTNNKKIESDGWKDAQRDAELTGVFCVNLVSQEMAWAMNASAAPLGKGLSEFQLMRSDNGTQQQQQEKERQREGSAATTRRTIPTPVPAPHINAPYVAESPMFMECRYVKTVKIPDIHDNDSMYSLIIGEVVNIHVRRDVAMKRTADDGSEIMDIDIEKMKPVARLGYGQEYTVVTTEIE